MTRASLLHVLDHSLALGPQEVRELEQLAQAFPYCQTAHLLLAKAAHDQGTMLAGQRLRRAATYAADRALLRRLIEAVPPVAAPAEIAAAETAAAPPAAPPLPPAAEPEVAGPQPARFVVQRPPLAVAPEPVAAGASQAPTQLITTETTVATVATVATVEPLTPASAPTSDLSESEALPGNVASAEPVLLAPPVAPEAGFETETAPVAGAAAAPASVVLKGEELPPRPALAGWSVTSSSAVGLMAGQPVSPTGLAANQAVKQAAPVVAEGAGLDALAAAVAVPETLLAEPVAAQVAPAEAPVPGAAAAISEAEPDVVGAEQSPALPVLVVETLAEAPAASKAPVEAATKTPAEAEALVKAETPMPTEAPAKSAAENPHPAQASVEAAPAAPPVRPPADAGAARFEYGLADALDPTPAYLLPGLSDEWTWTLPPKPFVPPARTPAAFLGDETVGYAWGESSRLGLALSVLATDSQQDWGEPAAFALPLPNDFFAPDALLQQHWAEHRPQALPPPTSLELIETFLRQKPRLTRPAFAKTSTETPTDLAAPSTNAPPELISESLARILARQGKLARAIEVYERLMVKHPEKMAYFATEIQSLKLQQPPLP